ncbi:MAG: hypothetical protein LC745_07180 [Planctomycetia bacterium]|nr:hypothetical protein [Planctomycetia bacterium]
MIIVRPGTSGAARGDGLTVYAGSSRVRGLILGGFRGTRVVLARKGVT